MKVKKSTKKKSVKSESEKEREDWYNNIPESELNPNAKEDFDRVLEKMFPPITVKF
ncbi:MAG TPA: hypothetical protein VG603_07750 [Chitinophagales bacterium]|nr:hypothetical protein [Chitinophagales bacterium]